MTTIKELAAYAVSIALVPLYVNMFSVWNYVSNRWDGPLLAVLPILITIAVGAGLILLLWRRRRNDPAAGSWLPVLAGVGICLAALMLPDPRFPVKRIHVAEYLLLSLIVRLAMSYRLQGRELLLYSACFTGLLGMHDEFLQGLHPARTYGLRDMLVNGLGACGGALIWHGFGLFRRPIPIPPGPNVPASRTAAVYLVCLAASIAGLALPAPFFRTSWLPFWLALPLIAVIVQFSLYEKNLVPPHRHGIIAVSGGAFLLVCYPLFNHVAKIAFF